MTRRRPNLGNERGAVLVLVALSLVVLLGMGALAVDLTAAYAWRTEAQKIADSAALAGGSAFLDLPDDLATPVANERAYEYALKHTIKGVPVDSSEVTVQVILAERKVRVGIRRDDMPTWFARVLGITSVDITARAAAVAKDAGAARCLKPLALPDLWQENSDEDDGDGIWEPGEEWVFDPETDHYQKLRDYRSPQLDETGYGSIHRDDYDRDYGRQIQLKASDPNDPYNFSPGIFFPWRLPTDDGQEECASGGGGGGGNDAGGAIYRQNLCTCNNSLITIDTPYEVEPGNMIGPTAQGVKGLIDQDPNAYWDDATGKVMRRLVGGGVEEAPDSPRIMKIALFRPDEIVNSGMQTIRFNNFALMFLEEQGSNQDPVIARFMYFPTGDESPGSTTGSLVRVLRLVE